MRQAQSKSVSLVSEPDASKSGRVPAYEVADDLRSIAEHLEHIADGIEAGELKHIEGAALIGERADGSWLVDIELALFPIVPTETPSN